MSPSTVSRRRAAVVMAAAAAASIVCSSVAAQAATPTSSAPISSRARVTGLVSRDEWLWPLAGPYRMDRLYAAPAQEYGSGHRGIDLLPLGPTSVRAPDDGVVAFAGSVAGRGIVTIDHGDGVVSTLEPVEPSVVEGAQVARGDVVGTLAVGGHAEPGRLHLGARRNGDYVNPLLFLGGVPRAVLLPCCD